MIDPDLFSDINSFLEGSRDSANILDEEEVQRLIISLANRREATGFEEEEAVSVIRWAERVRIESMMLNFVLDGTCDVDWKDNEATLMITEYGRKRYDNAKGSYGLTN